MGALALIRGVKPMSVAVNLDALIPREDFEAVSANDDAPSPQTINVRDLVH
jgi:hypothetical protein